MRNWLIYEPPGGARPTIEGVEKFVTVREGFSKTAFFFAPFWLAAKRCWLALALWVVALAVAALLARFAGVRGGGAAVLLLLPSLAIGLEAAWIRARSLERRGFALAGSAMARTREEAEAAFFQEWLANRGEDPALPSSASRYPYQPSRAGVLGFFPEPGGAR